MCNVFRTLYANEIDVRVQSISKTTKGVKASLLLYKDARVDMNLLDETFGYLGWQREHTFKNGRNYCKVSVKNPDTGEWISKEDVGIESNTEEVKGEASDAFKRVCVNFGIGRELYSSPSITVALTDKEVYEAGKDRQGNPIYRLCGWVKFKVATVVYDNNRAINNLVIVDQDGNTRYASGEAKPQNETSQPPTKLRLTLDAVNDVFLQRMYDIEQECIAKGDKFKMNNIIEAHYIITSEDYHKVCQIYESFKVAKLEEEFNKEMDKPE